MKAIAYGFTSVLLIFLVACQSGGSPSSDENLTSFGEPVPSGEPIAISALMSILEHKNESEDIIIRGIVQEVCKMKGCWMDIVTEEGFDDEIFVQFKNQSFTVPTSLAGKRVLLYGSAIKEENSDEEVNSISMESNDSVDNSEGGNSPDVKFKFIASGVQILE